jgi:hypothetical protein
MAFLRTAAIVAIVSIAGMSNVGELSSREDTRLRQNASEKCRADPDPRYRRQQILEQLAGILKQSIPKDAVYFPLLHADREGKKLRFFVYDLTEPENIHPEVKKRGPNLDSSCIRFVDNHVYHFSPFFIPYSFSHIGFLEDGELKVFKLLNCEGKGDSLDDVVGYLNQKLKNNKEKDEVIRRVKDYRKFGHYFTVDDTAVRCHQVDAKPKL